MRQKGSSPVSHGTDLVACSVIAKNYLAHARVLSESFLKHNSNSKLYVLLADKIDGYFNPSEEQFQIVTLDDLEKEILDLLTPQFLFSHNVYEYSTAVKALFLEYLLNKVDIRKLVFLDPDILVTDSFRDIDKLLNQYSIILTPHFTEPIKDELANQLNQTEVNVLLNGVYNLGFLAIAKTDTTVSFLDWWKKHLHRCCFMDPENGIFVDQKFMDLVPGMFDNVYVLRYPGYNVANWNVLDRCLIFKGNHYYVNNKPLVFFHFSNFDPEKMDKVSEYAALKIAELSPDYRNMFKVYRDLLYASGYQTVKDWPLSYGFFNNGVAVPDIARKIYRESVDLQRRYPDPFSTSEAANYFNWLNSDVKSQDEKPIITQLWHEVYRRRIDVQKVFPDIFGDNRVAFTEWIMNYGSKEFKVDSAFLPFNI